MYFMVHGHQCVWRLDQWEGQLIILSILIKLTLEIVCHIFTKTIFFRSHIFIKIDFINMIASYTCNCEFRSTLGNTYLIINIFETKIKMVLWAALLNGSNVLFLRNWLLKILWKALFKLLKILAFGIFNVKSWEYMVQKLKARRVESRAITVILYWLVSQKMNIYQY